jgi:CheY-like chemotaxis protein
MEQLKNILWIDDDIKSRVLEPYIDEFKDNGFTIIRAANPDEGNQILNSQQDFQCIIVDITMALGKSIAYGEAKGGLLTGWIILKNLINDSRLDNIKKIVFTIVDNAEVREYCAKKSIPYLEKQKFLAHTLVAKVKEILAQDSME